MSQTIPNPNPNLGRNHQKVNQNSSFGIVDMSEYPILMGENELNPRDL